MSKSRGGVMESMAALRSEASLGYVIEVDWWRRGDAHKSLVHLLSVEYDRREVRVGWCDRRVW